MKTTHPYDVLKENFSVTSSRNEGPDIVIVGVPHLSRPLQGIEKVCEVLIGFAPDLILVENIPATTLDKEAHYNRLFSQTSNSPSRYTDLIEEMIHDSGITREQASQFISTLQPDDKQARLRLARAHFINRDELNASYQWYMLAQENIENDLTKDQPKLCRDIWNTEVGQIAFPVAGNMSHDRLFGMDCQPNYEENLALLKEGMGLFYRQPIQALRCYLLLILVAVRLIPAWIRKRLIFEMNTRRSILKLAKANKSIYSSSDILGEWHRGYLDRNQCMVEHIVQSIHANDAKRTFVLVGASHVGYFLCLLREQLPTANLLILDDLLEQSRL